MAVGSLRDFEAALIGPIQANSKRRRLHRQGSLHIFRVRCCCRCHASVCKGDLDAIRRGQQTACGRRNTKPFLASVTIWVARGVYATYMRVIYGLPARLCLPPYHSVTSFFVFISFTLSFLPCFRFHAIFRLVLETFLRSSYTANNVPDWQPRNILLGLVEA